MSVNQRLKKTEHLFNHGPLIPTMVIKDLDIAIPFAKALYAGGMQIFEITLRTPVALEAIRLLRAALPEALVGAGTVRTVADLEHVIDAGAQFALSPGSTKPLLEAAIKADFALIPGICSASELMEAFDFGYRHFKFFPAEACGGVKALQALAGPFPDVLFCPTGGINHNNYLDYLAQKNVCCVGGGWLLSEEYIQQKNWPALTEMVKRDVLRAKALQKEIQ